MKLQEQIISTKSRIEKLRFQLAVEEKVLLRLKDIEEPGQSGEKPEGNKPSVTCGSLTGHKRHVTYGSLTGQLKQILKESGRSMAIKEMVQILESRGITSNAKQGFNVAISSALFKRKDIFKRIDRGVYELKANQLELIK